MSTFQYFGQPNFPPQQMATLPYKQIQSPTQNTLYIGDLEEQISEELLFKHFSKYGPIQSLKLMLDRFYKKSRGFAFLSYYDSNAAEQAKLRENHSIILNKPIRVISYTPKIDVEKMNVFFKDPSKSLTIKDIDAAFNEFGRIFSSKLGADDHGQSLGYGYICFLKKEDKEKCLNALKANQEDNIARIKIKDVTITVEDYSKNQLVEHKNLYVKNLPKAPEDASEEVKTAFKENLKQRLHKLLSKNGERNIVNFDLKTDVQKRFFGFFCFAKSEDAQKALKECENSAEFVTSENPEKLYVGWSENKTDRFKHMKEKFIAQTVSDTNLYTKNLLRSVTFEQLRLAYSKFGEITHMRIVTPKNPAIKTNFGYINYGKAPFEDLNDELSKNQTETDPKICAKNALIHALSDPDIKRLYENDQHFLTIFVPKKLRQQWKNNISIYKNQYEQQPAFYPQFDNMGRQISSMPNPQFNFYYNPYMMQQPLQSQFLPNFNQQFNRFPGQIPQQIFQQGPAGFPPHNYDRNQGNRVPARGNRPNQNQGGFNNYNNRQPQAQGGNRNKQNYGQNYGSYSQNQNYNQQRIEKSAIPNLTNVPIEKKAPTQELKQNLEEFLKHDVNKQREILGNLLFPLIKKYVNETLGPKITGMLIDFTVFEVSDILEFIENEEILKERIKEAEELINSSEQQLPE